jgi:hypothetical protein
MGVSKLEQRQLLFDTGAEAFAVSRLDALRSRPELRGRYVCPLCIHAFPMEALAVDPPGLTLDEAPPRASTRGPMTKVLTCRFCNNEAGRRLEGELKKRRTVEDFAAGRLAMPTPVDLEAGDGTRVKADATFENGDLKVTGVREATHPKDYESHWFWWSQKASAKDIGVQFAVRLPSYDLARSQIALVKAAYLVAFAAFGYSYIGLPQLDCVRDAIQDPDGDHLRRFPILLAPEQDPGVHRIFTVTHPFRSICIAIGQDFVLLPWFDSSSSFWGLVDELGAGAAGTITLDVEGHWPRVPEYRLDGLEWPDDI